MNLADVEKWRVSTRNPKDGRANRTPHPRIWHQCTNDSLQRSWVFLGNGRYCTLCEAIPPKEIIEAAILVGVPRDKYPDE